MEPREYVNEFALLRKSLLESYLNDRETLVGSIIGKQGFSNDQMDALRIIIETAVTASLYTVLLGLDGCASIGERQIRYKVLDDHGNVVAGCGLIEGDAYELLQEK